MTTKQLKEIREGKTKFELNGNIYECTSTYIGGMIIQDVNSDYWRKASDAEIFCKATVIK